MHTFSLSLNFDWCRSFLLSLFPLFFGNFFLYYLLYLYFVYFSNFSFFILVISGRSFWEFLFHIRERTIIQIRAKSSSPDRLPRQCLKVLRKVAKLFFYCEAGQCFPGYQKYKRDRQSHSVEFLCGISIISASCSVCVSFLKELSQEPFLRIFLENIRILPKSLDLFATSSSVHFIRA